MPNSLDLDDDLDSVEVVQNLESAFDAKLPDVELKKVKTVGELFDLLQRQIDLSAVGRKCATAMAFYRLKHVLNNCRTERISPSTNLADYNNISVRLMFKRISKDASLKLPRRALSWIGGLGVALVLLAFIAILPLVILNGQGIIGSEWLWMIPGAFAGGTLAIKFDPGRLPKDCQTLGELAQKVTTLNYGKLVKLGAHTTEGDIWREFREIVSQMSRLSAQDIQRDTVFFRRQLKSAA